MSLMAPPVITPPKEAEEKGRKTTFQVIFKMDGGYYVKNVEANTPAHAVAAVLQSMDKHVIRISSMQFRNVFPVIEGT